MANLAQGVQNIDAIQQKLLDRAKEAAARRGISMFYSYYGLPLKSKDETKQEVRRLWSLYISSENITHFKHNWQGVGADRPSVEFRFSHDCQRLTELRDIARNEGFAPELDPDGAHYNIESAHWTLSSDNMIVAPTLEIPQESPPDPLSTVPFLQDSHFEDCGLLDEIQKECLLRASRLAIVGLGGVGKSKLAVELSFRIREKSPEIWFLWINARNADRLKQSFVDNAERLKIQGRQDPEASIFELVINWLCNGENGKWVLVLDNVVHENLPTNDEAYKQLWQTLASCTNGTIIITTRSYGTALRYVHQNDVFPIEPMNESHAVRLMQKSLDVVVRYEDDDLGRLVQVVDYMPMAIIQAAAYISHRWPLSSVRKYIDYFQKSNGNKIRLLSYGGPPLDRDWDESCAFLTTLQWSFDYLRRTKPSAANLLSIMSFFHRGCIPDQLLRQMATTRIGQSTTSQDLFEEDIRLLQEYSLISVISPANTYQMLNLVQIAIRNWLDILDQTEKWRGSFINLLSCEILARDKHMGAMEFLFPHIQSAASKEPALEALSDWSLVLHEGAEYAKKTGELKEMKRMARSASQAREKLFGRDDKRTMASFKLLAVAQVDTAISQLHEYDEKGPDKSTPLRFMDATDNPFLSKRLDPLTKVGSQQASSDSVTAPNSQREVSHSLLTIYKDQYSTAISIGEVAVEERWPFGRQLRKDAVSQLTTSIEYASSSILMIDWNNLEIGIDLNVLPPFPEVVKTLQIINLPTILRNPIPMSWQRGHWIDGLCQRLRSLNQLVLTSCGYRDRDMAALKRMLPEVEIQTHRKTSH